MTTTTLSPEELEAQELEGFISIDQDPVAQGLVWGYKAQRRAAKLANDLKGKIGDRLLAYITERGGTALVLGGQPMARKQIIKDKTVFDEKRFKDEHPQLHAQYMTRTIKGTIKVWVRPQDGDDPTADAD